MFYSDLIHIQIHLTSYGHIYCNPVLVLIGPYLQMLECKQNKYGTFSTLKADYFKRSGPITSIIKLILDLMVTYILTKSGADWLILVDASVKTNSNSAIFP